GTKESASVVGYQYGDKYIKNKRQSRKELMNIIKLEPLAYQQYRQANVYNKIAIPLVISGFATGIFGFKYMFADNPTKVPLIAGTAVGITGLVLNYMAHKLSLKCIQTFNSHATTDTENTTDGNFGFMFGINYNPVMHRSYPALVLNF
ncbi:MAG TPA: hypothetical protein VFJ43_01595, partial [Bacteroidia bacterium]|nr:hypothetical protein [Bacteroidia bacterium]